MGLKVSMIFLVALGFTNAQETGDIVSSASAKTAGETVDAASESTIKLTSSSQEEAALPTADTKVEITALEQLMAGSVARMVAQTVLHPIDVVRTRRQAVGVPMRFDAQTLVRGITPQFWLAGPAGAVQFGALEFTRRTFNRVPQGFANKWLGGATGKNLIGGAVGALAASVFRVPQEVLKQGVQAGLYDNAGQAFTTLWGDSATGRIARFYRGFTATVTRDIPWNALSYAFFQALRSAYLKYANRKQEEDGDGAESSDKATVEVSTKQWQDMAFGATGGAMAAVLTHPIDVIKTRIMTAKPAAAAAVTAAAEFTTTVNAGTTTPKRVRTVAPAPVVGVVAGIAALVKNEGPGVLVRGLLPRILFLAPLSSLVFATYEAVTALLLKMKRNRLAAAPNAAANPLSFLVKPTSEWAASASASPPPPPAAAAASSSSETPVTDNEVQQEEEETQEEVVEEEEEDMAVVSTSNNDATEEEPLEQMGDGESEDL